MQQNLWKKLSENKKNQWIILLLIGILLVVIAIPTSSDISIEQSTDEWNASEMENRLENILGQMKGIEEARVMITYKNETEVEGIVVVTKNGGNSLIIQRITDVVRALFDVDAHKIKVIESK